MTKRTPTIWGRQNNLSPPHYLGIINPLSKLEVYIAAKADVVAINAGLPSVTLVVTLLDELPAEATNVSYEANFVAQRVRDTGLKAKLPNISALVYATYVEQCIGYTTVNEELEVTSLCKVVTQIRIELETIGIVKSFCELIVENLVTILSVSITNQNSYVQLVIELVTNLRSYNKV